MPPLEDGEWDDATEAITDDYREPGSQVSADSDVVEPSSDPNESHRATQDELSGISEPSDESESDPPAAFDPRYTTDFEGLLYIGKLSDEFDWMGHRFVIRTLTTEEIIDIGLLHKPYVGSLADVKAYQAAVVAACVELVDGRPISVPISNDFADSPLRNRFEYVRRHWYPSVLDVVYEKYLLLEAKVNEVLQTMGKAHG